MKKCLLLIILSLSACSNNQDSKVIDKFNFDDNLSLEEFKSKVENYVKQSSYPNIDD